MPASRETALACCANSSSSATIGVSVPMPKNLSGANSVGWVAAAATRDHTLIRPVRPYVAAATSIGLRRDLRFLRFPGWEVKDLSLIHI